MSWSYLQSASIRQILEKYRSPAHRTTARWRCRPAVIELENRLTPSCPVCDVPNLHIAKDDGQSTASPGQELIYTLTLGNFGPNESTGVTVTETVPDNTTFVAADSSAGWSAADGAPGGTTATFNVGDLVNGQSLTLKFAVRVNASVPAGTNTIENCASITDDGTHGADRNPFDNTACDTDTLTIPPPPPPLDLSIVKDDGVSVAQPGQTLTYTLTIRNVGQSGASGVTVGDTLPAGVTFVSASDGGTFNSGAVSWDVGNLAIGDSTTRTLTVTVNDPVTDGLSQLVNTATVTDDHTHGPDVNPSNNTSTDTDTLPVPVIPPPPPPLDLAIAKDDGVTVASPGQTLVYTVTISNVGQSDATGVTVSDALPRGVSFASASDGGTFSSGAVSWNVRNLSAGASVTRTVTVLVNALAAGQSQLVNTATVTDDHTHGPDVNPANNTATDTDTVLTASLSGAVYLDQNKNGLRDSGEPGIVGVTVNLVNGATSVSTVTGPNGSFSFTNLTAGTYSLQEVQPNGYDEGATNVGSLGGTGSTDNVADIVVTPGAVGTDYLFGEVLPITPLISPETITPFTGKQSFLASTPPSEIATGGLPGATGATPAIAAAVTANGSVVGALPTTPSFANSPAVTGIGAGQARLLVTGADAGGSPLVRVFNYATKSERDFLAYDASFTGGVRVAVGDVNGDGVPDIITAPGAGGGPNVKVFDGATGDLLLSFYAYDPQFAVGVNVAAGDVDGDGRAEIVTAPGAGGGPNVKVFAPDGTLLQSFYAYDPTFAGGVQVAAGDFTGAGRTQIATAPGAGGGPNVKVFGPGGQVLASFYAFEPTFSGGVNIAAGDVTGTGVAQLLVGAGMGGGPRVTAYSLTGGVPVAGLSFYAADPSFAGGVRIAAADLNGDGRADIISGTGPGGPSFVTVTDPTSLAALDFFVANATTFTGGVFVAAGV